MSEKVEKVEFSQAIIPILIFFVLLIYGLFIHPQLFDGRLPLEVLILIAISAASIHLFHLGYDWHTIQSHIVKKVGESVPIVMILFAIGVLIGSWIVSGTIPMLIYYGISIINGQWIYIFAFLICIIFSLLTGTSWGSAGTIGIVMMGIAEIYGASLPITAAAVVGGSFFGDKMSPLSDTTNIASLATGVHVMDHIKSMTYTTGPSALIAALIYFFMSPGMSGVKINSAQQLQSIQLTLAELSQLFHFNILLLLPLVVVVWGSVTRRPIFLTLLGSAWLAMILAFVFQDFSFSDVFNSFNKGFSVDMAPGLELKSNVVQILNRGGLYNLIEGIVISILIFAFIGVLDVIDAIPLTINSAMKKLRSRSQTVAASLTATWITNLMASNQYATSFIIGSAFNKKYDEMKINRKVLSRTLEDAGTMMENLAPWTPSGIFMAGALGVSVMEYAPYQFLSWINIIIAYIFAFTGIACFYGKEK
jgi:NhaC family Na+:H+ antiporter